MNNIQTEPANGLQEKDGQTHSESPYTVHAGAKTLPAIVSRIKPTRAVAFVDGQALFYAARELFGHRYANYDVLALSKEICKQKGWELAQVRFYAGVPSQSKEPTASRFWTMKIRQMRSQGVYVFTRELSYRERIETLPDGRTQTIYHRREKGVDVRIALDVFKLAYEKAYEVALLFTQDQDTAELVDYVREVAKQQVRQINIASAFPCSPTSRNRRGVDRTTWIEIDKTTYDSCLDAEIYEPNAERTPIPQ